MDPSNPPATRKINLKRIAHVYYAHKDVGKARVFLEDFGFREIKQDGKHAYYGGTGAEPFLYCLTEGSENEFQGAAFVVETMDDLEYAAQTLPRATAVHEMSNQPGNGHRVTFCDPVDGFPFHLVHGQTPNNICANPHPEIKFNFPNVKNRPGNQFQRFKKGPAPIFKLGHFGMCVTNFAKALEFYTSRFNFKPSDLVYDDQGRDMTAFLHLDRGQELVDHHCFFIFEGPMSHIHHSSYETFDFDTQLLGHDYLRDKGYKTCWGVGRHVMGSQIFDYWFDPSKFIVEHYVDGDLVDSSHPIHRSKAAKGSLHVWGPEVPPGFLD